MVLSRAAGRPLVVHTSSRGTTGAGDGPTSPPVLFGHFAVLNRWTEVDNWFEGRFLERFAAGAFVRSIARDRGAIKVMFQHGRDPYVGQKPLGPIAVLREDNIGGYYEVPLLEAHYVRELVPALEEGLLGASFRFRPEVEERVEKPGRSRWNPDGIPEVTRREVTIVEFGPVVWPAYPSATAAVKGGAGA